MNYTQVIIPRYDSQGRIRGKDQITGKVYSKKDMKVRPDIQQRLEKALNTGTYLVTYPRGTRHGFKFISKDEGNIFLESLGIIINKKQIYLLLVIIKKKFSMSFERCSISNYLYNLLGRRA